jgi:cell division protein FtsQ
VNIFIHSGRSAIKERLEKDPYFSDVKVSISLPSTLKIRVTERRQVAAIVYGNQYVVIDVNGTVLRKTSVDPKVTLLRGLILSRIETGSKVKAVEKETLKSTLEMISSMKKGDFYFKKNQRIQRVYQGVYIRQSGGKGNAEADEKSHRQRRSSEGGKQII